MREIVTDLTLPNGRSGVSVMYFDEAIAAATQQTAVETFWGAVKSLYVAGCVARVRNAGRLVDAGTGTLTGAWSAGSTVAQVGTNAGQALPDAAQALVRWRTSSIVNGRFVKGHTSIPGLGVGNITAGNLSSGAISALATAANNLAAGVNGMVIWHRPGPSGTGAALPVTSTQIWPELAVLRRRRG